jgi:membrane protein
MLAYLRVPLGWKELLKRSVKEALADNVFDLAAQQAYYFFFALFPAMLFVIAVASFFPLQGLIDSVVALIGRIAPSEVVKILTDAIGGLSERNSGGILTFAFFVAIWSSSGAMVSIITTLNAAYDVTESRPWWKTELASIVMTFAGALLVLVAVALLVAGGQLGFWLAAKVGIESYYVLVMRWLRWPLTAVMIMTVAALTYYLLPDVKQQFKFITPGSVIGTLLWLLGTWGFGQYVAAFGDYNVTYGSIGGVIVLLAWLYLSGFIFLMGGEVNAILEHAATTGKAAGARAEGEKPAPPEERPSAMPPGAAKDAEVAKESGVPPPKQTKPAPA